MRRVVVVGMLVLLAGCLRPAAETAEPDRPSPHLDRGEVDGEILWLNGTMRLSPVPGDAAALAGFSEPHNCFVIDDADDEDASFLGGIVVDLEWTPTATGTQMVNVTIDGYDEWGFWQFEGPSPLHLVVGREATGSEPVRTPLAIRVAPADLPLAVDQQLHWSVQVGVLESQVDGLRWTGCSEQTVDP